MKIVEQTETKLVLREFPWNVACLGIVILGFAIIGMFAFRHSIQNIILNLFVVIFCLAVLCFTSEIVTCTFNKSLNNMILKRQNPLKTELIKHSIEAISGIKLEVMIGDNSDLYRVSIILDSGKCVPLTSAYTSDLKDNRKTAEDIATFLNVSNYGIRRV
jgi:hypothetical protein